MWSKRNSPKFHSKKKTPSPMRIKAPVGAWLAGVNGLPAGMSDAGELDAEALGEEESAVPLTVVEGVAGTAGAIGEAS